MSSLPTVTIMCYLDDLLILWGPTTYEGGLIFNRSGSVDTSLTPTTERLQTASWPTIDCVFDSGLTESDNIVTGIEMGCSSSTPDTSVTGLFLDYNL